MEIKQDDFEKREQIDPIPGQMCYDELLLPNYEEEKEKPDTSVAAGQMDLWSLPKQEEIAEVIDDENDIHKKTEKSALREPEKKIEFEEKIEQKFEEKTDEPSYETAQEKSSFEAQEKTEILEEQQQEKSQEIYENQDEEKVCDEVCESPVSVVLDDDKLESENDIRNQENPQEIESEKSEVATEKEDDFEKENFAFQAPRKLRKTSILQNNFVKESTAGIEEYLHIEEEQDLTSEEDEKHLEDYQEMTINFENPPKKLEKSEINASKSHFFGNYENPFED